MTPASHEATLRDHETRDYRHPFRVAVVGCGPKGMYSLERLQHWFSRRSITRPIDILVFEPADAPGAGRVYDPGQPHHLRMNFAARHIDAWMPGTDRPSECLDLMGWLDRHYPHLARPDGYPPRAIVGEYLNDCFRVVLSKLDRIANVRRFTATVDRVRRDSRQWQVTAGQQTFLIDELLLTVGHEGWRSSTNDTSVNPENYIGHVFPVARQLSMNRIPRNSTARLRGFGLSWIDAALTLTEGRGGQFVRRHDRWRYVPSGNEPRLVLPFSRSGRPMLAKPVEAAVSLPSGVSEVWESSAQQIRELHQPREGIDFLQAIWPIVVRAANDVLELCNPHRSRPRVDQWFRQWRRSTGDATFAIQAMQTSYEVANGWRPPDSPWALGHAWRSLYGAIVDRVSHGGLAGDSWKGFRPICVEMERIAFGPPAENVGRILALVESGIVHFGSLGEESSRQSGTDEVARDAGDSVTPNLSINAVLPSATEFADHGPLPKLLREGIVRRLPGAEGIEVDRAGRPIDANGNRVKGLAIIGRPTEGCVLGNDSLSRKLHNHPDRWAQSVIEHCAVTECFTEHHAVTKHHAITEHYVEQQQII